jgi:RNA polymerase sigma-70 factor, ECF subfamily
VTAGAVSCLIDVETLVDNRTEMGPVAPPSLESAPDDFAELYRNNSREIFYLTLRLLGDSARAEDATHDVFLKAYKKWADFHHDASPRTWLYRIAINHCSNLRQSWHSRHIVNDGNDMVMDSAVAGTDSPLQVLETKELGERIQKSLDQMSEEYRLLLLLVADQELSYDEIAALTGQTADAVRGKLHRARKAFVVLFQKTS